MKNLMSSGQEDLNRMSSVPTASPSGLSTPMRPLTSQTSASKKRQAFLSQHDDLLGEPVFECTKTLLDHKKVDYFPSSPFQSSSNSPGSKQKLTRAHSHFHGNYSNLIIHLKM